MVTSGFIYKEATDRPVLEHIARHGMTTARILAQQAFMNKVSEAAAQKRLTRLRKAGYLHAAELFERKNYWILSTQAANLLGEPAPKQKFLKEVAKLHTYAGLVLCTDPDTGCGKLTRAEFAKEFPEMIHRDCNRYYISLLGAGSTRLGYYHVDRVPDSRKWTYTVSAIKQYVAKRTKDKPDDPAARRSAKAYRHYMRHGQFEITIITAIEHKVERLEAAFAAADIPKEIAIRFYVIQDLIHLLRSSTPRVVQN